MVSCCLNEPSFVFDQNLTELKFLLDLLGDNVDCPDLLDPLDFLVPCFRSRFYRFYYPLAYSSVKLILFHIYTIGLTAFSAIYHISVILISATLLSILFLMKLYSILLLFIPFVLVSIFLSISFVSIVFFFSFFIVFINFTVFYYVAQLFLNIHYLVVLCTALSLSVSILSLFPAF